MKIEKISDNQIKFILNRDDLLEYDLKITEIAYGSERAQAFFREMLEQAMVEHDFFVENTPLMIEAVSMPQDGIVIIVTKVRPGRQAENSGGEAFDKPAFDKPGFDKPGFEKPENTLGDMFHWESDTKKQAKETLRRHIEERVAAKRSSASKNAESGMFLYSFENLGSVEAVAKRLDGCFVGDSSLYKYESLYFLYLEDTGDHAGYDRAIARSFIPALLAEYGNKHAVSVISKYYLQEHGSTIIAHDAIGAMSSY